MTFSFSLPSHHKLNYQKNFNILAEDYKTIYFNTQKNANSTLKAQFVEILGLPKTEKFPSDIHYNYNFPCVLQEELQSRYQDYLAFSVLRNPWERLASCYTNKIKVNSGTGKDYILESSPDLYIGMPFEEFVEVISEIPDSEADYHFCSQIYLMLYPDGTLPMNYLCNIEKLDIHIEDIKRKTGIPFTSIQQLNSSGKSNYASIYTPTLIDKVSKRYQADIAFFKYKFGIQNEAFTFGKISNDWIEWISKHPLMLSLVKEKNRELLQTISLNALPESKEIKALKREIKVLKKEIEDKENSISWKLTKPIRNIFSIWRK